MSSSLYTPLAGVRQQYLVKLSDFRQNPSPTCKLVCTHFAKIREKDPLQSREPEKINQACSDKRSGPPGPSANMCEESSGQVCMAMACVNIPTQTLMQEHSPE